ncbi:MAG: HEAT repeat domain-containing protein [Pirellulales bacterium]
MLDQALAALKTFDWGADLAPLKPIEEAVVATHGDAAARQKLESQLTEILKSDAPRAAKDYVCRVLMQIGSADSVPTLAALLASPELSHMARFALYRIPAPASASALREAAGKLTGEQKIGVIATLGARGDNESVAMLGQLLGDADAETARAAAMALGAIRSGTAAQVLTKAKPSDKGVQAAVIDAALACAEGLVADGKKAAALAIYKSYAGEGQPKHVRLAATRGMLAAAGK